METLISLCQLTRQQRMDLVFTKGISGLGHLLWLRAQRLRQERGPLGGPLL